MSLILNIKYGKDSLDVYEDEKIDGYFNHGLVMSSDNIKEFSKKSIPVLTVMTSYMSEEKPKNPMHVNVDKKRKNVFQELINYVEDNPRPAEVYVLETKPDEVYENTPAEECHSKVASSGDVFGVLQDTVKFSENIKNVISVANDILRTEIPSTVWGAKDINKSVDAMKTDIGSVESIADTVDELMEKTDSRMNFVGHALGLPRGQKSKKMFQDMWASSIENTASLRKIASNVAQALNGLLRLDDMVKASTGYPSTWFFDASAVYDFNYGYEDLIKGIMKSASAEFYVLRPLKNLIGD